MNLIGTFSILTITCTTGLIAYAVYYKCDLLSVNVITKGEQVHRFLLIFVYFNSFFTNIFFPVITISSYGSPIGISRFTRTFRRLCLQRCFKVFKHKLLFPNKSNIKYNVKYGFVWTQFNSGRLLKRLHRSVSCTSIKRLSRNKRI